MYRFSRIHSNKDEKRILDRMIALGTVVTSLGTFVAVGTLAFGLRDFNAAQDRWRKEVATRAVSESSADQPFISHHCLGAVHALDDSTMKDIHARREGVQLSADQTECVRRCFSDLKPQERLEVYVSTDSSKPEFTKLSAKGTSLLAQRANAKLDKDELVANLVMQNIGDEKLLTGVYGPRICNLDKAIVEQFRRIGNAANIVEWMTAYQPILDFSDQGFCRHVPTQTSSCSN